MFSNDSLSLFVQYIQKVPDPRSPRGRSHHFSTILAITLLGLLADISIVVTSPRRADAARGTSSA